MRIGFKTFRLLRTAFFLAILQFLCFVADFSHAQEGSLFNVDGVNVDITAENAVSAREKAFESAQVKAFNVMVSRMLSDSEAANFAIPDMSQISFLVQDYEVYDEKLSTVRYIATYNFRFKGPEVRRFFSGTGLDYADVVSQPTLVLPYYQKGSQTLLWSHSNLWMQAWARTTEDVNGLLPLVVPMGDLPDIRDVSEDQGLNIAQQSLQNMLRRYDASEAVLLVATPDDNLVLVNDSQDIASGNLAIYIYRTDRGRPEFVQPVMMQPRNQEQMKDFLDRSVLRVTRELQKNWKAKVSSHSSAVSKVLARVEYGGLGEWAEIQKLIRSASGLGSVNVKSITPNYADLELASDGNFERMRLALSQVGLEIEAADRDVYMPKAHNGLSYNELMNGQYRQDAESTNQSYKIFKKRKSYEYQPLAPETREAPNHEKRGDIVYEPPARY